jgi:hypothetical protein
MFKSIPMSGIKVSKDDELHGKTLKIVWLNTSLLNSVLVN